MAYYNKIKKYCISNGDGIRTAIFFSGCPFKCKGCFNSELWNPKNGQEYTNATYEEIKDSINEHIAGISILGGEPLVDYNYEVVLNLCRQFKEDFPSKDIWLWTGFLFEEIKDKEILKYIDVLIDGQFDIDKKDATLQWRGSSNQRIIRIPKIQTTSNYSRLF